MSRFYTNIRLLVVTAILSMALPAALAQYTTNLYLTEGSSAVLMDYSAGEYVMRSALAPGDNIIELQKFSYVAIFPAPGVDNITVTPEDDYMKFVDDQKRGKKYYLLSANAYMQEKYTVTTSGGQAPDHHDQGCPRLEGTCAREERTYTGICTLHGAFRGRQHRGTPDDV